MEIERKKTTMKDIAKKLNISVNAVSLALNNRPGISEETRELIVKTAQDLGYFENYMAANKNKNRNICLMIEQRNFSDVRFYSKVIIGIENEAKKNDFDIIVTFINRGNCEIPSCIETKKVSGILIVGTIDDSYLSLILAYNIPVALVDHVSLLVETDAILSQNIAGSYSATKYLIDRGHREIGFFGDIESAISFKERWIGFSEAIKKYGLNLNYDYCILSDVEPLIIRNDYKKIANIVSSQTKLPTAWICGNDSAAVALYNALDLLNIRVPDQVSVIGFDDIELCKTISPQLTTVKIEKELMGTKAMRRLIWRMDNLEEPFENIKMAVQLVERESVRILNS